jgi:hypothetical protein
MSPTVSSFGPEACYGEVRPEVQRPAALGRTCLGLEQRAMTAAPDDWDWAWGPPRTRPVRIAGHWLHKWEADPAWAQAKADFWSVEVADLLCRGCETRRQRLIGEGLWPA